LRITRRVPTSSSRTLSEMRGRAGKLSGGRCSKEHGVRGRKPLHALRKRVRLANQRKVRSRHGERVAETKLGCGYSRPHYGENRKRGTTGLGALLKGFADNVIELDNKSRDASTDEIHDPDPARARRTAARPRRNAK